jgi:SAM-dependent methyltransferase
MLRRSGCRNRLHGGWVEVPQCAAGDDSLMSKGAQYPEHFVKRLEIVWGKGFLSPGGPEEVREIVDGIDLRGKSVLDIGCGLGGPSIVLAREMGVARIIAIDVEPSLVQQGNEYAEHAGLTSKIEFRLVEPGPLPFAQDSFDVVFSKDALIHIPDKQAIYREILRVLRQGGVFLASDWLGGENTNTAPEWKLFRELGHLDFTMATAAETHAAMTTAGFENVSTRDRNTWYAKISRFDLDQTKGPLRERLIDAAGEEIYFHWLKVRQAHVDSVAVGALRPTHLRGFKPLN